MGCNHVSADNPSNNLIYDVVFRSNRRYRITSAIPVNESWLDQLERIDAALVEGNVPVRRWKWLWREPLHPECLNEFARQYGDEDLGRIIKLLRIEQLGTN